MNLIRRLLASATVFFALFGNPAARAQEPPYPSRPIRLIVPYTPGGTADLIARYVSDELGKGLNQPVVIEYKPGASLIVGAQAGAAAKPDGYTLFMGTGTSNVLNALLRKGLPYDPAKDFVPVALLTENLYVLAVPASSAAKDLKSLLELAKSRPSELAYATWGAGNLNHLGVELLGQQAGVKLRPVPYKGSSQADIDLVAGQVDFAVTTTTILPFVKDGRARALAVTSRERAEFAPHVPTIAEQGFPGFEVIGWFGIFAPTGTPAPIVTRLNSEISKAMRRPEIRDRFVNEGLIPVFGPPSALSDQVAKDNARWGPIIDSLGLREKFAP